MAYDPNWPYPDKFIRATAKSFEPHHLDEAELALAAESAEWRRGGWHPNAGAFHQGDGFFHMHMVNKRLVRATNGDQ